MKEDASDRLNGTQEVLFSENEQLAARVIAMGQAPLRGAYFKIENAPTVSRKHLGLALCVFGLGVLYADQYMDEEAVTDIHNLIRDMTEQHLQIEDDDIPF